MSRSGFGSIALMIAAAMSGRFETSYAARMISMASTYGLKGRVWVTKREKVGFFRIRLISMFVMLEMICSCKCSEEKADRSSASETEREEE